jgi:hypothetical protein
LLNDNRHRLVFDWYQDASDRERTELEMSTENKFGPQ